MSMSCCSVCSFSCHEVVVLFDHSVASCYGVDVLPVPSVASCHGVVVLFVPSAASCPYHGIAVLYYL